MSWFDSKGTRVFLGVALESASNSNYSWLGFDSLNSLLFNGVDNGFYVRGNNQSFVVIKIFPCFMMRFAHLWFLGSCLEVCGSSPHGTTYVFLCRGSLNAFLYPEYDRSAVGVHVTSGSSNPRKADRFYLLHHTECRASTIKGLISDKVRHKIDNWSFMGFNVFPVFFSQLSAFTLTTHYL